jgi:L-fucose isomerase
MGIAGSIVNQEFLLDYLDMRSESADMTELVRRIEENIYDQDEYEAALNWVKENCIEGDDYNPKEEQVSPERKRYEWETVVKMTIIARDMMVGNPKLKDIDFEEESMGYNAIAAGFQGQRQWTDHFPNGDFMEAMLNSSFDWNGFRQPYIMATENDSLNGVSMLFGHLLTNTAQIFSDVRTYWSPEAVKRVTGFELSGDAKDGFIHLINSGPSALDGSGEQSIEGKPAMKPWYEIGKEEAQKCLDSTTWGAADMGYFRGGGFSSTFNTKGGMPITMSRINIIKGLGPALQIAEGYTIDLPDEVHLTLTERTNPTWPTTWFVPRLTGEGNFRDVYSVMANWGANHGAFSYGHLGSRLMALASMLRIPICMHNVPEEQIFRPSSWSAFGMDKEGADYRACEAYGPLYK